MKIEENVKNVKSDVNKTTVKPFYVCLK